jgi:hypothetical protein
MSLDAAIMDLSKAFEYGQGYVALSRVRRLSGLYLIGFGQKALSVHPDILLKDTEFKEESRQAAIWIDSLPQEERSALEEVFVTRSGGKIKKEKAKKEPKPKTVKAAKTTKAAKTAKEPKAKLGPLAKAQALVAESIAGAKEEESSMKSYSVEDVRQRHANAYEKWTDAEQDRLIALHGEGAKVRDIAAALGRNSGGIKSRLKKLGLVQQ